MNWLNFTSKTVLINHLLSKDFQFPHTGMAWSDLEWLHSLVIFSNGPVPNLRPHRLRLWEGICVNIHRYVYLYTFMCNYTHMYNSVRICVAIQIFVKLFYRYTVLAFFFLLPTTQFWWSFSKNGLWFSIAMKY